MTYFRWRYLRYFMVLTVQTPKVTASTGNGETLGARMEVIKRLLLDRVDGQRTGFTIDFAHKFTFNVATTPTDTRLAIGNLAMMRTELTLYPFFIYWPKIFTFY